MRTFQEDASQKVKSSSLWQMQMHWYEEWQSKHSLAFYIDRWRRWQSWTSVIVISKLISLTRVQEGECYRRQQIFLFCRTVYFYILREFSFPLFIYITVLLCKHIWMVWSLCIFNSLYYVYSLVKITVPLNASPFLYLNLLIKLKLYFNIIKRVLLKDIFSFDLNVTPSNSSIKLLDQCINFLIFHGGVYWWQNDYSNSSYYCEIDSNWWFYRR